MHYRWRRFLPKQTTLSSTTKTISNGLMALRTANEVNDFIDELKNQSVPITKPAITEYYRTLLLAQTPRAVLAQWQMDAHKHGFHNREKRLYELIDFNDSLVALLLSLEHDATQQYVDNLKIDMDKICRRFNGPVFTAEQFDAITRGLGREIAIYRAAKYLGFGVRMTSRTEDAFGIDMVITHPETRFELNIDCKTPSAYRRRLEEMVDHKKITDAQLLAADENDFITTMQSKGKVKVPVTLLCVRPETLGNIHDFNFEQPERLEDLLNEIFATMNHKKLK